ncbi:MAG: C39 family peptidase [Lachnospiraceae bacterium]|nr:C39 family peptidase [Lachnospiraceae bacterium]
MDRFTNYNNGDSYDDPNYNGYKPVGSYNHPEYSEATGYTETTEYTETIEYTETTAYRETTEYDTPNYGGVPLTDVPYSNSEYSNLTYGDFQNTNYEYEIPQYSNEEYNETFESQEISPEPEIVNETTFNEDSIFSPLYPEGYAPTPKPDAAFQPKQQRRDYSEDDLTEEELADIRRQKAIARRKKLAARERRRRERRKQAIIRCSILLAIVILLIVGFVMLISGLVDHFEEKKKERELSEYYATSEITTEEPIANIDPEITAKVLPADRDAALAILQEQAENDSTMQSICDSAAAIPDIILQHLAINPEMKDFTLSYPAMINIVFDGEFDMELEGKDVPLYLQFDKRWGYADYSTDIIGLRGAGPTALSMAYTYLKQDGSKNPIKVADYATEKGYLDEDGQTHWSLMTEGAEGLGLQSTELKIEKEAMIRALEDKKVIICMVSKGDFTTDKHFIVIRDYKDGFFYVNDPTSTERSEVGWDFRRLRSQISKMCALEAGTTTSSDDDSSNGDNQGTGETGDDTTNTPAE